MGQQGEEREKLPLSPAVNGGVQNRDHSSISPSVIHPFTWIEITGNLLIFRFRPLPTPSEVESVYLCECVCVCVGGDGAWNLHFNQSSTDDSQAP